VSALRKYQKKSNATVIAVKVDLDTDGFSYRKWGAVQLCKGGDWLVSNQGDTYTVDQETFEATYSQVSPGVYSKTAPVWAEVAEEPGAIETKEGVTHYEAGNYLVFNAPDRKDGYAVGAAKFNEMYKPNE
jgi:hypothetical protein